MTNLPSLPNVPSRHGSPASRVLAAALLVLSLATMLALWSASPASAVVTEVAGTTVGLQPRAEGAGSIVEGGKKALSFDNASGNAVLHGTNIYGIYWDPKNVFHHEWLVNLDTFFQRLGNSSGSFSTIFAPLGQYRDRTNTGAIDKTTFMGSYSDTSQYPTAGCTDPNPLGDGAITCLTDAQLREQLQSFIAEHGTPKGMHTIYYLMTPPGVTVCVDAAGSHCSDYTGSRVKANASYADSFCSYHGDINPDNATEGDANTILYSAIPWTAAGTLGLFDDLSDTYEHAQGVDCQDGGWNPEGHEETLEFPKELNEAEEEAFKKADDEEKATKELEKLLEKPHQEEPNQDGKGEEGDYGAGLTDILVGQIAEEQANTVTDPLLNGWQNSEKLEATDLCRNTFANTVGETGGEIGGTVKADLHTYSGSLSNEEIDGGRYYINNVWSLGTDHCVGGTSLVPRFTLPDPVNNDEVIGIDGMESTVGLDEGRSFGPTGAPTVTYATYTWNFGDGTPAVTGYAPGAPPCEAPWLSPCAGSAFHTYQYGGNYAVSLTITDVAGDTSKLEQVLHVNGPAAPAASAGSPGGATSTTSVKTGAPIVNPLATAAVLSRSLKTALKRGLAIGYSVNEQVAGHFDVLISSALAKKLGLHGARATGLPAGTPAQVIIARAVIVTTKAGHSTVRVKFSKAVTARLRHQRKLALLLQMYVRNAASKTPATTTVLSAVTLAG